MFCYRLAANDGEIQRIEMVLNIDQKQCVQKSFKGTV